MAIFQTCPPTAYEKSTASRWLNIFFPPTPAQNTPFPGLSLKVGKLRNFFEKWTKLS